MSHTLDITSQEVEAFEILKLEIQSDPLAVNDLLEQYDVNPDPKISVRAMQLVDLYDEIGKEAYEATFEEVSGTRNAVVTAIVTATALLIGLLSKNKKKKVLRAQAKIDAGLPLNRKEEKWRTKYGLVPAAGSPASKAEKALPGGGPSASGAQAQTRASDKLRAERRAEQMRQQALQDKQLKSTQMEERRKKDDAAKATEELKKKKQMQLAWGITGVILVGLIITVIVLATKD